MFVHCIGCWCWLRAKHTLLFVIAWNRGRYIRVTRANTEQRTAPSTKNERAKNYDNLFLDDLYKLQSLDMLICSYFHHMYTRCRRFFSVVGVGVDAFFRSDAPCSALLWVVFSFRCFRFDIRSNYSFGAGAAAHHFWMRILFFGFCVNGLCVCAVCTRVCMCVVAIALWSGACVMPSSS